jgi:hypothetical protein
MHWIEIRKGVEVKEDQEELVREQLRKLWIKLKKLSVNEVKWWMPHASRNKRHIGISTWFQIWNSVSFKIGVKTIKVYVFFFKIAAHKSTQIFIIPLGCGEI